MATKINPRAARAQKKRTLTQQTISAISGLFKRSPKVAPNVTPNHNTVAPPTALAKQSPVLDIGADKTLLDKLLAMPADTERDIRLVNFAIQTSHAALRWEAAQAVQGEAGWIKLSQDVAGKDRRIAKYVKDKLQLIQAKHSANAAWLDLSQRYMDMAHADVVDVRHFMDLDKAFDTAHATHQFDSDRLTAVRVWRDQLQHKLQRQTLDLRDVQAHRDALKQLYQHAKSGQYTPELLSQFDSLQLAKDNLPKARGLLAIQRLHIEIDELTPNVNAALAKAKEIATHRQEISNLLTKISQTPAHRLELASLRQTWQKQWVDFPNERMQFDALIEQAATKHQQAQVKRTQTLAQQAQWLTDIQAQLATALDTGQGQLAVKLSDDITSQVDLTSLHQHHPEQATALERLLAQAREAKNLLWEGASREREALIDKARALAEKPLIIKYQAQALKDLQNAWKLLKDKAGPAPHAQFAAFKAACDTAYEPVKTHQDSMRAVMAQGTAQRQAQIDELNALLARVDWSQADWSAVEQLRQEAKLAWRNSLPSDYKQRTALSNAHEQVMDVLETQLGKAREQELARRQVLTQQALDLAQKPFAQQHTCARQLMEQYQTQRSGVSIPRSIDQKVWQDFKAAIDAVYTRRDQERQHSAQENAQALTTLIQNKQSVLNQLQQDITTYAIDTKRLKHAIDKALNAWDDLGRLPRNIGNHEGVNIDALVQTWLATVSSANTSLGQAARTAQTQRVQLAWEYAHALDIGDETLSGSLQTQLSQDETLKKAFVNRTLQTNSTNVDASIAIAVLDAEIAAGVASPQTYQSARMQRQVQRLSDKLSGSAKTGTQVGFDAWLNALALPGSTLNETGERLRAIANVLK